MRRQNDYFEGGKCYFCTASRNKDKDLATKDAQETIVEQGRVNGRKRINRFVGLGLSLAIGIALLFLVYRKFDFVALRDTLRSIPIHYGIILLTIVLGALGNVFRGLRWQLQMEATAPPHVRRTTAILATLGSYAVSLAVPRGGEVWRGSVVVTRDKVSVSRAAGTIVIDRVMDLVMLLLIALIALIFCYGDIARLVQKIPFDWGSIGKGVLSYRFWLIVASFILLCILLRRLFRRSRFRRKLSGFKDGFARAMRSVFTMPHKGVFILYSVLIWVCYYLAFRLAFYAFPFTADLSAGVGLIGFIMGTLGVMVPVQAGIGTWHYMIITTLTLYGVSESDAGLFALVLHTLQTAGTAFVGLLAILLVPLRSRKNTKI